MQSIYGGYRPTRRPVKSLQIAAGLWPVKRLQIGRRKAGYKACNMLATNGWRSMVKLNKIGEYSSILTNVSATTTTNQKLDPRGMEYKEQQSKM
jgi:hypothetical protein